MSEPYFIDSHVVSAVFYVNDMIASLRSDGESQHFDAGMKDAKRKCMQMLDVWAEKNEVPEPSRPDCFKEMLDRWFCFFTQHDGSLFDVANEYRSGFESVIIPFEEAHKMAYTAVKVKEILGW